ncbi:Ldh family oxidoreductase [Rhodocytophaga aerolata]|uniref:Ldh family oxidoreductase n=1 Tax=Rhodocytophaga aerolata TaxID=455078 RepID=A0ABT8RG40_9BACT|nr:Ldh family oxidoreductase [Rhodocytophaga aerolata]MDO1450113.1 Ldh family oxidoreductase [Rhodocytophaga aerolata]
MYTYTELQEFTRQVFVKMGCPEEDARLAAEILVSADLRGIDSHGVARLPGYVRLQSLDRVNPKPNIRIVHQTPSTAVIDGDAGLGLVVAPKAMEIAIEKAQQVGTSWVAIRNSNHFGIAGYYAMMALQHDMIGLAMTHAGPLVAPTFSQDKLLGTNPIAIAIPADKQPPFVADFATTTAAYGKLEILQRKSQPTPTGWVQNAEGKPSTDAHAVKNGGALLPLGGDREHGSHKGYCLGAMVDILCGVLSGANYGPWVPPFATAGFMGTATQLVGAGTGHMLGAMRVDAFRPAQEFKEHMDNWINTFRAAKPVEGEACVQIPGDAERMMEAERKEKGIPVLAPVIESLNEIATKFGLPFKRN